MKTDIYFSGHTQKFTDRLIEHLSSCGYVLGHNLLGYEDDCLTVDGKHELLSFLIPAYVQAFNIIFNTRISYVIKPESLYKNEDIPY